MNALPHYPLWKYLGGRSTVISYWVYSQACILVVYGDHPLASENMILGQFDVVYSPPVAEGQPRIEISFRLDANLRLSISATDLDSQHQVQWVQRGTCTVEK